MATDDELHSQARTEGRDRVTPAAEAIAALAPPIPLAEHQMDPLQSFALQQELPGLTAAFDEQRMQAALQATLFDNQRPRATIERCEVEQATYVPGECVILRY